MNNYVWAYIHSLKAKFYRNACNSKSGKESKARAKWNIWVADNHPKANAFWSNPECSYTRSGVCPWIKPLCRWNQLYKLKKYIGKLSMHIIFTQDLIRGLWKWSQGNWIVAQTRLTRYLSNKYFMFFLKNLLIYCKKREIKARMSYHNKIPLVDTSLEFGLHFRHL